MASAAACPRVRTSSLRRIADTWWSTVFCDSTSRSRSRRCGALRPRVRAPRPLVQSVRPDSPLSTVSAPAGARGHRPRAAFAPRWRLRVAPRATGDRPAPVVAPSDGPRARATALPRTGSRGPSRPELHPRRRRRARARTARVPPCQADPGRRRGAAKRRAALRPNRHRGELRAPAPLPFLPRRFRCPRPATQPRSARRQSG